MGDSENFFGDEEEGEKKLLSAVDILDRDDQTFVDVYVEAWKGTVRIRALTAKEAMTFLDLEKHEGMIQLVSKCAIDANGKRLFTDDQVNKLKNKNFSAFITIQRAAMKLNALREEDAKNA